MAMACFRLVTFFPLRPDLSLPRLNSCISRFTSFPADGEYLRRDEDEDFFVELFFALLFLALDFFAPADFFFAAFLVAITILPRSQMVPRFETVVWATGNPARIVHKTKARREMIPGAHV